MEVNYKSAAARLQNSAGFSSLEVLTALVIDGILALAVVTILVMNVQGMERTKGSLDLETQQSMSLLLLQETMGSAIEIDLDKTGTAFTSLTGNRGRIISFKSKLEPTVQPAEIIAAFLYETGKPMIGNLNGELSAAGIFMVNPTPTSAGVLKLVTSHSAAGTVVLSENGQNVDKFDKIVELEITPTGYVAPAALQPARSLQVRIVMRKFLSNEAIDYRWCPQAQMDTAECKTSANFNDVERILQINFKNNLMPADGPRPQETLFGSVYFYQAVNR